MNMTGKALLSFQGLELWSLVPSKELLYVAQLIGEFQFLSGLRMLSYMIWLQSIGSLSVFCIIKCFIAVGSFSLSQPWLKPWRAPKNRIPASLRFKNVFLHPTQSVSDQIPLDQFDLGGLLSLILSSFWSSGFQGKILFGYPGIRFCFSSVSVLSIPICCRQIDPWVRSPMVGNITLNHLIR